MRRKTSIFGWLLVPVWLAVVTNISFDASFDGGAQDAIQALPSDSTEHGQHGAPKDSPPIKHALHHQVRRVLVSGEPDGKPYELTDAMTAETFARQPDSILLGVVKTPAEILQCWNFHMRNALEPRAPSTASSVS